MITLLLFIISSVLFALLTLGATYLYLNAKTTTPLFLRKESLQNQIVELDRTLTERKNELSQILIELKNAENTIAEGKVVRGFLNTFDKEYAEKTQAIYKLNNELKTLTSDTTKAKQTILEINQEISSKSDELQKLNLDSLNISREITDNEVKIKSLKAEIKKSEDLIESLKAQIEEKGQELSDLISKMKLEQLERDIENKKFEDLKAEIKKIETTREELTEKSQKLEKQIDSLSKREAELKGRILTSDAYAKEIVSKNRWSDLDTPYIKEEKVKAAPIKENEFLNNFKNSLAQKGIVFNERIINAFHTSLKVEDSSPLVVLAGISGTGKSLLPRLYANAIGMNFLQIAVQPRWDSPQDLFGFYNYMEQKFKASELSRMLWQYDIYNNNVTKSRFKKSDELPMNLVLLDEMNLAKVEYYFSDMLSKLEARRGINFSKKEERLPAEIEFECTVSSGETDPRRLFIGGNTLFVGTMNEDESTQSISDKVMDRANVMRFGRPKDLVGNPSSNIDTNENYISLGSWEKWKASTKKAQAVTEKLKEIVYPINDELEKIGRPFAFRVWQAMTSYVNNYPDPTIKYAIADQIEMKILPKLNGLEKDEKSVKNALDNISKQIEKLKDNDLIEAFEKAKNAETPFFQWRGIMR